MCGSLFSPGGTGFALELRLAITPALSADAVGPERRGRKMTRNLKILATVTALTLTVAWKDSGISTEKERAVESAGVLQEILKAPDKGIPKELLEDARAIAVIPHVIKGAFVIGGEHGKGLVAQREGRGKWSAPSYVDISGGSFGFQIGASATDFVLVFTNSDGIKPLLKGKLQLGADASLAAGPVGRSATAGTDITLRAAVYSYSRTKGAFAGIALDGAVLSIDDSANQRVYGAQLSAQDILLNHMAKPNEIVEPFLEALRREVPAGS
jgi:lipid-binding SYLF domain-containing protein